MLAQPSDNQLTLSFGHVPAKVKAHGLRDAHVYPLVSRGKHGDDSLTSFRVASSRAWKYPSITTRSE